MATSSAREIAIEITRAVDTQKTPEIVQGTDVQVAEMVSYAKSIAPVRTGKFRESIHSEKRPDIAGMPARRIVTDDPKAPYLEYGTKDTPEWATFAKTANRFKGDQRRGAP